MADTKINSAGKPQPVDEKSRYAEMSASEMSKELAQEHKDKQVSLVKSEQSEEIPSEIKKFCNELSDERIRRSSGWLSAIGQEDEVLKQLILMRGFDRSPKIASQEEIDKLVQNGSLGFARGMKVDYGADQYKYGDMFVGRGIHGHGVYVACFSSGEKDAAVEIAQRYATKDGKQGSILIGVLESDAHIVTQSKLTEIRNNLSSQWSDKENLLFRDSGKLAVALGYDAIDCENGSYYIVLNRGKTIVGE